MGNFFSKKKSENTEYTHNINIDGETIYYKPLSNFVNERSLDLEKKIDILEEHVEKLLNDKLFYDFLDKDHKYILSSLLKNIQDIKSTTINKDKMTIVTNKINGIQEYIQRNKNNENNIEDCNETTSLLMK